MCLHCQKLETMTPKQHYVSDVTFFFAYFFTVLIFHLNIPIYALPWKINVFN